MALTAAPSAPFLSPRPTHRPAAMAAASVTRTSSSARLRSGRSPPTRSDPGTLESDMWAIVATFGLQQNDRDLGRLHARPALVVLTQPQVCDRLGRDLRNDRRLAVTLHPHPRAGRGQLADGHLPCVACAAARPLAVQADRVRRYDAERRSCGVDGLGERHRAAAV